MTELDLIEKSSNRKKLTRQVTSKLYEIVGPYILQERTAKIEDLQNSCLLLETQLVGICHADLRYVSGNRPPELLHERLPMCVFHEGIARVAETGDDVKSFSVDDAVVIVPNVPCYIHNPKKYLDIYRACRSCRPGGIGENLCEDVRFLASNAHGLSRSFLVHPASCAFVVPAGIPEKLSVLTEPLSVVNRAVKQVGVNRNDRVAILGGGFMGYLVAAVLSEIYDIKKENLLVTDVYDFKLEKMEDFAVTFNTSNNAVNGKYESAFDVIFECAGGRAAAITLQQALNLLSPGGRCLLLGVSEDEIPIRTRMLLEKGLLMKGTTRSAAIDYPEVLQWLRKESFRNLLTRVIHSEVFSATSAQNIISACKVAEDPKTHGKVLIDWRE